MSPVCVASSGRASENKMAANTHVPNYNTYSLKVSIILLLNMRILTDDIVLILINSSIQNYIFNRTC